MGGHPRGPHTETLTVAHTHTYTQRMHTHKHALHSPSHTGSHTHSVTHQHTYTETLLRGAIETSKEHYKSKLLSNIPFQGSMQQSFPSHLHPCNNTERTNIRCAVVFHLHCSYHHPYIYKTVEIVHDKAKNIN